MSNQNENITEQLLTVAQPKHYPTTFDAFFFSRRDALHELHERRKNTALRQMLDKQAPLARAFAKKWLRIPRAVLFRQVATPTHEVLRFLSVAKQMGLKPFIFEYYGDTFVSAGNAYKRSLGKMPLYQYTGADGRDMVKFKNLFDFNLYSGKKLSSIVCDSGESLVDFHHRIFGRLTKMGANKICVDATDWLRLHGDEAPSYYKSFLTLFVRDSILFENFEATEPVQRFLQETVFPAFTSIEMEFGHRPLIVRLLPEDGELRAFWDSYPKKTERFI